MESLEEIKARAEAAVPGARIRSSPIQVPRISHRSCSTTNMRRRLPFFCAMIRRFDSIIAQT